MSEPVHQIGMTELYNEIRGLGDKFTEHTSRQGVESAQTNHRVGELEKDLTEVRADIKAEAIRRSTLAWQLKMAFITALASPILVTVISTLITAK